MDAVVTSGADVLLDVARSEGVTHVFGNPGTTELPFVDALSARPDLRYVLGLQEASVVAMADGYAQATGRPALLNLHTSAGLGNAIGNLTNALANRTPLVVTVGQQDLRHIAHEPLLSGPLTTIATGAVKTAVEARTAAELGTLARRAFLEARTPPAGPVLLSLPMDLLDQDAGGPAPPPSPVLGDAASAEAIEQLADLLVEVDAGGLALVVDDEVAVAEAIEHAVRLAELLACPVFGSPLTGRGAFPPGHPLWRGQLPPVASAIGATLAPFARVLLVGGQAFLAYPYSEGPAKPDHVELLHVSPSRADIGRTWPVRLGVHGGPGLTLAATVEAVERRLGTTSRRAAVDEAAVARRREAAAFEERALGRYGPAPCDPMAAVHAVLRSVPDDAVVVDEAITAGPYVRGFHRWSTTGRYFACRGGGIGWGMPAAVGVSLGRDRAPVVCFVGDGSAMYSPQAIWTAARERVPVLFVVLDNGGYLILERYLATHRSRSGRSGSVAALDIGDPHVDFVALARSMGITAHRAESTVAIGELTAAALASDRPQLVQVPVTGRNAAAGWSDRTGRTS